MRRKRLRWLGHVRRMDDGRWPKQMMYAWIQDHPRPKGKPKQRWRDVINRDLKALGLKERWYDLAAQREEWRTAIHKREQARFEEAERQETEKIRNFRCPNCPKTCKTEKGLKCHMSRKHANMCQKCGKMFDNPKSLWSHGAKCKEQRKEKEKEKEKESSDEWEHHGKKNKKEQKTTSSAALDLPPLQFKCNICCYSAQNLTGLKSHIRSKHPDGKPSTDLNSRSSSTSSASSSSSSSSPRASKTTHQCPTCGFTCSSAIGLWKHKNTQHKSSASPTSTLSTTSTSDLPSSSSLTKGQSPVHRPLDGDSSPG